MCFFSSFQFIMAMTLYNPVHFPKILYKEDGRHHIPFTNAFPTFVFNQENFDGIFLKEEILYQKDYLK